MNSYIDPVIMDRGRGYLSGGHIVLLEEVGELIYRAEVEGGELYEVYVELDEDGTVLSSECDCPYDYGPICKHQAAVLLKLRDKTPLQSTMAGGSPLSLQRNLKELLEAQSKESLISLLLSFAADSEMVEQRVKLHVSRAGGVEELAECRKLIQTYINTYSDEHGFVSWRNVDRAVEGAEMVAEKARQAADDAEWVRAVRINLCILEEMLDLLQAADDSGGTIGGIIEESLERIQEVVQKIDRMSQGDHEEVFRMLLEESGHSLLDGWPDWQLAFLEFSSSLAVTADLRKEWEEHVSQISSRQREETWSGNYFAERLAMMRYRSIRAYEGEERARDYLNHHLHFSDFREIAIRDALDNGRYDEAIRLAEEGEQQDQARGLYGLVTKWKRYRFDAYRRSGQLDMQRKVGEELVLDGDYSYYRQIKDTYSASEWPAVYQSMLQKLEKDSWHSDIYTRILVEEGETARLLEYVRKQPARIEEFYPQLMRQFPTEVKELFQAHIQETAGRSSTRKHYQDVCRIIRMLQQAGGKAEAMETARMLLAKYPKKPAFREELMKLNYR
jgi:hypothetical protein